MGAELKPRAPSSLEVVQMSLKHFAIMSRKKHVLVLIIVTVTIVKNLFNGQKDATRAFLEKSISVEHVKINFIIIAFYNTLWASMNFLTDYIFEKQLTPYGGYIAVKVLRNVLNSNSREIYDVQGSSVEYFVTEGGKAMAKISRFIIFAMISKLFHFVFGLRNVMLLDTSNYKVVTMLLVVSIVFLSSIKLWKIKQVSHYSKATIEQAYEKEKVLNENLTSMAIIKSYRAEDHSIYKFNRQAYQWEEANIGFRFWMISSDMLYNFLSSTLRPALAMAFVYMWDGRTSTGEEEKISAIRVLDFLDIITEMLRTVGCIITIHSDIYQSIELANEVVGYINLAQEEADRKVRVSSFNDSIEVQSLMYAARDKVVFSDVSFTLRKGDKCVLFGRNGAGKSSIFKLLLGFEEYRGTILFDGVDLGALCMSDYRGLVTYVPQDTRLFDETIYYNLSFGNGRAYGEIIEECKRMGIHDSIMAFPSGYNTPVGMGGKAINGGLRQKIFYTRAFLCDTEIYLFDEPTNNLDVVHSGFLLEYVRDPKYARKTFFVICHDIDIVREFPKILRFDDGRVVLEKDQPLQ